METIIQKSFDSEKISKYFHEEIAGRSPLIILDNSKVFKKIKLTKFNKPVKILTEKEISKQKIVAYIEFKYILTEKEHGSVSFKYIIEGIEATVDFKKKEGEWEISKTEVVEN